MTNDAILKVLMRFNENWRINKQGFCLDFCRNNWPKTSNHKIGQEFESLKEGKSASLPYFVSGGEIAWCTVAPGPDELRKVVEVLHSWIIPSYGWEEGSGGLVPIHDSTNEFTSEILEVSPAGYFRWRSHNRDIDAVCNRLSLLRRLESSRPARVRPYRPSLYELRSAFVTSLLIGDRDGAEEAIGHISASQLDSAANVLFMKIRMWHHFREYERIVSYPDLARVKRMSLPNSVREYVDEALGIQPRTSFDEDVVLDNSGVPVIQPEVDETSWSRWFAVIENCDEVAAEAFLRERSTPTLGNISSEEINHYVAGMESIFLNDDLLRMHRGALDYGIGEFIHDFVLDEEFPRSSLADLYLALLRVWSSLHAGSGSSQEGNVLLELARATLRFNRSPKETLEIVQHWWESRRVPSRLTYLLDAIELLEREHPDRSAPVNLWLDAADFVRRSPQVLSASECNLWRDIGHAIGMDDDTINTYLPVPARNEEEDPLVARGLQHIAIVCMWERQAQEVADYLRKRCGARVSLVLGRVAGPETELALNADVVLFVWMATSHAIFRAFDRYDRKRMCYVQGTGVASMIRTLEKWSLAQYKAA